MHTLTHQRRLQVVSDKGIAAIDKVIEEIREENPDAFHDERSLCLRVFAHEPKLGLTDIPRTKPSLEFLNGLGCVRQI